MPEVRGKARGKIGCVAKLRVRAIGWMARTNVDERMMPV